MNWRVWGGIAGLIALTLPGCTSNGGENRVSVRASNSQPMSFEGRETGQIDLVSLIDPENRRASLQGRDCLMPERLPRNEEERRRIFANELSCAVEAFQTYYMSYSEFDSAQRSYVESNSNDTHYENAVNSLALALRRNQIQDRIILRSDALCSDFQRRLGLQLRIGNDPTNLGNWLVNYSSLVVSGIGSLFLNGDAIFVISNAARMRRPGYVDDRDQLEAAIMQIASQGITYSREKKLEQINERRFFRKGADDPMTGPVMDEVFKPLLQPASLELGDGVPQGVSSTYQEMQKTVGVVSIGSYTLEQALTDVIDYHGTCSIASGLQQAADQLDSSSDN